MMVMLVIGDVRDAARTNIKGRGEAVVEVRRHALLTNNLGTLPPSCNCIYISGRYDCTVQSVLHNFMRAMLISDDSTAIYHMFDSTSTVDIRSVVHGTNI